MFLSFLAIVVLLVMGRNGIEVVVLVTLYTSCFAAGWGPTGWVYVSEIFPMAGRGKAVGAASASNWAISTVRFMHASVQRVCMHACMCLC